MNAKSKQEFEGLVTHILESCPGTTRKQAKLIARRMLDDPGGDILDHMFVD
jgi:hypothetical protein